MNRSHIFNVFLLIDLYYQNNYLFRKRLKYVPPSSVFSCFFNSTIFGSISFSPSLNFLLLIVIVPRRVSNRFVGIFSCSSSGLSQTREYSSWFVIPIFVQIRTIKFPTVCESSTYNDLTVPSNILTLKIRTFFLYSKGSCKKSK